MSSKRDEDILVAKTKEVYELKKEIIELHKNRRRNEENEASRYDNNTSRTFYYEGQQPPIISINESFRMNESFRFSYQ
jgi:hypothetical protein